ncbi:hypothetical protein Bca52824_015350 [Brassica carinata]|uniref:Uncharacterized protein n=1 Tax=Brassica carinata TaxID=52824 RepID=A0A8X8B5L2_BRACI|nr:hypothetical protein Bca52824_015350 [Brassica carinata]
MEPVSAASTFEVVLAFGSGVWPSPSLLTICVCSQDTEEVLDVFIHDQTPPKGRASLLPSVSKRLSTHIAFKAVSALRRASSGLGEAGGAPSELWKSGSETKSTEITTPEVAVSVSEETEEVEPEGLPREVLSLCFFFLVIGTDCLEAGVGDGGGASSGLDEAGGAPSELWKSGSETKSTEITTPEVAVSVWRKREEVERRGYHGRSCLCAFSS